MPKTTIEWVRGDDGSLGYSWPVINGCKIKSRGCEHCYAMTLAATRLKHTARYTGLAKMGANGPQWTGAVKFIEKEYDRPLRLRKPARIFVCDMGDLFYEKVPDAWIDRVFAMMASCPQHTFIVLTKRIERAHEYLTTVAREAMIGAHAWTLQQERAPTAVVEWRGLPLPNVWLLTSVEDQATADERIPVLLDTPAAIRGISAEPLLGPIDLANLRGGTYDALLGHDRECLGDIRDAGRLDVGQPERGLDWVIPGGESGPHARPMHPAWPQDLRDQCVAAGVAFLFKQWGAWVPADGGDPRAELIGIDPEIAEHECSFDEAAAESMVRRGKKLAGRWLDGRTWDEFPRSTA